MLKMKPECERCHAVLAPAAEAYVCSFECTFCPGCTQAMAAVCPNCSGELVRRPKRTRTVSSVATTSALGWMRRALGRAS